MDGPCDHGGIHVHFPGDPDHADDVVRDMAGLVRAVLRGDEAGRAAIVANADLQSLVHLLAGTLAAILMASARHGQADPDAPPGPLTEEQLQAAEAILMAGIEGPDDDLGPGP